MPDIEERFAGNGDDRSLIECQFSARASRGASLGVQACFCRLPELFVAHRLNNFPLTVPPLPNVQKSMFLSHSFTARLGLKDYLKQTSLKSQVTGHFDLISAYLENFIAQIPDLVKWEDIESEILECNLERLRNSKTPFERRMVANRSTSNPFL
jgi:hypothetical protein